MTVGASSRDGRGPSGRDPRSQPDRRTPLLTRAPRAPARSASSARAFPHSASIAAELSSGGRSVADWRRSLVRRRAYPRPSGSSWARERQQNRPRAAAQNGDGRGCRRRGTARSGTRSAKLEQTLTLLRRGWFVPSRLSGPRRDLSCHIIRSDAFGSLARDGAVPQSGLTGSCFRAAQLSLKGCGREYSIRCLMGPAGGSETLRRGCANVVLVPAVACSHKAAPAGAPRSCPGESGAPPSTGRLPAFAASAGIGRP